MVGLLLALALTQQAIAAPAGQLRAMERQGVCMAEIDGRSFRLPAERDRLHAALMRSRARGAELHMNPLPGELPDYRCFGRIIRIAEKVGLRIGFISEPDSTAD